MMLHEAARPGRRKPHLLPTLAFLALSLSQGSTAADRLGGEYQVVNGQVDPHTYTGWRVFHSTCYICHGMDAVGSDVAPSLVDAIQRLSPEAFAHKVMTRYRMVLPRGASGDDRTAYREALMEEVRRHERGQQGELVMPAWGKDPEVKAHLLDLYGYLKARGDGALGGGEPTMFDEVY